MSTAAMTREEWLTERLTYLGGTDVAAIVGKHKYKTPLEVYAEKALGIMSGEQSIEAQIGIVLEPIVRTLAEKELGCSIQSHDLVRHPEHSFLAANLDGITGEGDLIEIKTHGFATASEWGEEMSDEIPDAYHVQATWYLGMTGAPRCIVVAFDRGLAKARYYVVESNPAYFAALVEIAVKFWHEHVKAKVEPLAILAADLPIVREIYAKQTSNLILASDEHDEIAGLYIELSKAAKDAQKEADGLKARLIQVIGSAEGIATAYGTFTYKEDARGIRSLRAPRGIK